MTRGELVLAATLAAVAVTGAFVLTGAVPHIARPLMLGWLGVLAVTAYGAYVVDVVDRWHSEDDRNAS